MAYQNRWRGKAEKERGREREGERERRKGGERGGRLCRKGFTMSKHHRKERGSYKEAKPGGRRESNEACLMQPWGK